MSTFDKARVVGLDADEMLGYFSLLTQLSGIVEVVVSKESMRSFIRSFAYELWQSELIGKTRFFRPGIPEFIRGLAHAFRSEQIKRVFILSNNPCDFMLKVIAEVINFYADPERKLPDLIPERDVFGLEHPRRVSDKKSIYAIRECLDMEHVLAGNIIMFDDVEQACKWQGCEFVLVKKYEYVTPIRAVTSTFFAEMMKFGVDIELIETYFPHTKSADALADRLMESWDGFSKDYMRRGMALSKDDEPVPGVNHEDLKDRFVRDVMLVAFCQWLNKV